MVLGFKGVFVESGAGVHAKFTDQDYTAAGATIVDTDDAFNQDIVVKVIVYIRSHGHC